jgi:hypothetical protein
MPLRLFRPALFSILGLSASLRGSEGSFQLASDGGLRAASIAHGLDIRFEDEALSIRDRQGAGGELRLRLTRFGRPGSLQPVGRAELCVAGGQVELRRGSVHEWYASDSTGLEQGFYLDEPPAAAAAAGPVVLALEIGTAACSHVDVANGSLALLGSSGETLILYDGLVAYDAAGRELPIRLAFAGSELHILVEDAGAAYPLLVDPFVTSPSWQAESNRKGSNLGHSVRWAGDVNGDGYEDVIVGAPGSSPVLRNEGEAWAFHGSPTGLSLTPNWTARGGGVGFQFGLAVAGAGDINADGYDDVIVGANKYTNGQTNEGAIFVYYGSPTGLSPTAAWVGEGNVANALFGHYVEGAVDVNTDGSVDVLAGSYRYSNGESDEGAAFAYHGSATGLPAAPSWTVEGNRSNSRFGASLARAGDVNGDGHDDVIIGARLYSNGQGSEGAAYVFHGSGAGLPASHAWITEANQSNAWYSWSVSAAGDVNGDGFDDVILGSLFYTNPEQHEGRLYAFHGSAAGLSTTAAWTFEANQSTAYLGGGVTSIGDINFDGYGDVAGTSYQWSDGQTWEGKAFAFLGSAVGIEAAPIWTAESNSEGARFGYSLSAADVNGDGRRDLISGAPQYTNGQNEEGSAYVYHALAGANSPPVAVCQDVGKTADATCTAAVAPAEVNGGSSDPDGNALTFSLDPPGPFAVGSTPVTLTVTDSLGASATCTATVTVVDVGELAVACPSGTVVDAGAGCSAAIPDVTAGAVAVTSCTGSGSATLSQSPLAGTPADLGTHIVTVTATDGLGNVATCETTVTIEENVPPAIVCPEALTVAASASCNYTGGIGAATATDNCSAPAAIAIASNAPAVFPLGTTTVTWTATDESGNVSSCQQQVTVADTTAPVITCPASLTVTAGPGNVYFGPIGTATASDNCGGTITIASDAPASFPEGVTTVTWAATDAAGLTASCQQTVTVEAYVPPDEPLPLGASWSSSTLETQGNYGQSVSNAGDINGDGHGDVVVGVYSADDNGLTNQGKIFVYHGSASGLPTLSNLTILGGTAGMELGISVSTAGDVNGDGYGDVIAGAHLASSGGINGGRAFVYHGSASGLSAAPAWSAAGSIANSRFGYAVSEAGDVNGDGYGDVIVGAWKYANGQSDEGAVYVYHGSATGLSATPDWSIESNLVGIQLGWSVSTAGDVNGDGYDDVVIGARFYKNGQSNEGAAYVYHGSPGGLATTFAWRVESNQAQAWFGSSVSNAGDVNGDGYDDVLVGARYYDNPELDEGRAYLYQGSSTGLSTTAAWTAEINQAAAGFSYAVSAAGDINADGFGDVIVGANTYSNGQSTEGAAYVYLGSATGLSSIANWMAEIDVGGAQFGYSVSGAGDVNGDGAADVIVGAPELMDPVLQKRGRAYAYYGFPPGP